MARDPWLRIGMDAWLLSFEASHVIILRMLKLAAGGAAAKAETRRMFAEKLVASSMLQSLVLVGALGVTAPAVAAASLRHTRRLVRANRRRLRRS
jgi:hypothetical protein